MPSLFKRRRGSRKAENNTSSLYNNDGTHVASSSKAKVSMMAVEGKSDTIKVWRRSFGFSLRKPSPKKIEQSSHSLNAPTALSYNSNTTDRRDDDSVHSSSSNGSKLSSKSSGSSSTLERRPSKVIAESRNPHQPTRQELSSSGTFITLGDDVRDDQSVDSVLVHKDYAKVVDALKVAILSPSSRPTGAPSSQRSHDRPSQRPHDRPYRRGNTKLFEQVQQPQLSHAEEQKAKFHEGFLTESQETTKAGKQNSQNSQSERSSTTVDAENAIRTTYHDTSSSYSSLEPTRPTSAQERSEAEQQGQQGDLIRSISHAESTRSTIIAGKAPVKNQSTSLPASSPSSSTSVSPEVEAAFESIERAIQVEAATDLPTPSTTTTGIYTTFIEGASSQQHNLPPTPSSTLSSLHPTTMTGKTRRKFFGSSPKHADKENEELQSDRRRNFSFMRQASPSRRKVSSATLARTREHAKQLAMLAGSPQVEVEDHHQSNENDLQRPNLHAHLQKGRQSLNFSVFDADSSIISGNSSIVSNSISTAISANISAYDMDSFDDTSSAFSGFSSPNVIRPTSSRKSRSKLDQYVESHRKLHVMETIDQKNSIGDASSPFHPLSMKDRLSLVNNMSPSDFASYTESSLGGTDTDPRSRINYPIHNNDFTSNTNATMRSNASVASHGSAMSGAAARRLMRRSLGEGLKSMQGGGQQSFTKQPKEVKRRPNLPMHSTPQQRPTATSSHDVNSAFEQGFSFDAFGLDETQVDDEVNAALALIAKSNPDLSLFDEGDSQSDYNSLSNRSFNSSSSSGFEKATPQTQSTSSTTLSSPQDSPEDMDAPRFSSKDLTKMSEEKDDFFAYPNAPDNGFASQDTYSHGIGGSFEKTPTIRGRFRHASLPDISTESDRSNLGDSSIDKSGDRSNMAISHSSISQPSDEEAMDKQINRELFMNKAQTEYLGSESDGSAKSDLEEEEFRRESSSRLSPTDREMYYEDHHDTKSYESDKIASNRLKAVAKRMNQHESDTTASTISQLRAREWASERTSPIQVSHLHLEQKNEKGGDEVETMSHKRALEWAKENPDSPVNSTPNYIQSWEHNEENATNINRIRVEETAQDYPENPIKQENAHFKSWATSDEVHALSTRQKGVKDWPKVHTSGPVVESSHRIESWQSSSQSTNSDHEDLADDNNADMMRGRNMIEGSKYRKLPYRKPQSIVQQTYADTNEMKRASSDSSVTNEPIHVPNGRMLPGLSTESIPLRKVGRSKSASEVQADRFKSTAPSVPLRKVPPRPPRQNTVSDEKKENFLNQVKLKKTPSLHPYLSASHHTIKDSNREESESDGEKGDYEESRSENDPMNNINVHSSLHSHKPKLKLTYKEKREIELKAQSDSQKLENTEPKKKDRDVASLIKRRIAANRRNAPKTQLNPPQKPQEGSTTLKHLRENLRKVSNESLPPKRTSIVNDHLAPPPSPPRNYYLSPTLDGHHKISTNSNEEVISIESGGQAANVLKEGLMQEDTKSNDIATTASHSSNDNAIYPAAVIPTTGNDTTDVGEEILTQYDTGLNSTISNAIDQSMLFAQRASLMESIKKENTNESEEDKEAESSHPTQNSISSIMSQRASLLQSIQQTKKGVKEEVTTNENKGEKSLADNSNGKLLSLFANRSAAMNKDSINSKDNPAQPTPILQQNTANTLGGNESLKNDPTYAKYFKMLKIGLPMDVVKHAMVRDGLDPSVMDGNNDKTSRQEDGTPLKDDPRYEKYFKMLKLGLPLGAVKNAMERDGEDSSVLDGDHNAPASSGEKKTLVKQEPLPKDKFRRTRLHWDTLRKVRSTSVWALVDKDPDVEHIEIDENEFAELFQAELEPSGSTQKPEKTKKRNAVKVIDPKRANNGGIILARLKLTYEEMAMAVESMDDSILDEQQLQGIIEYIPTKEEKQLLRKYMTSSAKNSADAFDELCECEKFMVAMMTVKHSKQKMRALLFRLQFHQCISDLEREASMIENACDELRNSVRLRKLLGIVLNVGNRLNTAGTTRKGKAGAFSIESLLKLNQAKAFDKKTTFLHYVVLVVQRHNESLSCFKEDLPHVLRSDKIYWDQCLNDLEEVENQLENMRKIALNEVNAKKRRKGKKQNIDDDEMSQQSMSLEQEVEVLRSSQIGIFTLDAIKIVSALRENVEVTKTKYAKLLEYFGEEDKKKMMPHELFKTIVTFTKDFDVAKEEVIRMEKKKKRDEEKKGKPLRPNEVKKVNVRSEKNIQDQNEEGKSPRRRTSRKKAMRLSAMQPNMSAVLTAIKERASSSNAASKHQPYQMSTDEPYSDQKTAVAILQERPPHHAEHLKSVSNSSTERESQHNGEQHSDNYFSQPISSHRSSTISHELEPQPDLTYSGDHSTVLTDDVQSPHSQDEANHDTQDSLPPITGYVGKEYSDAESRTTPPREDSTFVETVRQESKRDRADELTVTLPQSTRQSSDDLLRQRARAMRQKRRMDMKKSDTSRSTKSLPTQSHEYESATRDSQNTNNNVRKKAPTPGDMRHASMPSSNQRLMQRRERLARRNMALHGRP